jgi:hypothetical protein
MRVKMDRNDHVVLLDSRRYRIAGFRGHYWHVQARVYRDYQKA